MKESLILPDVQLESDSRNIPLDEVGISGFELPLTLCLPDNSRLTVPSVWEAGVRLSESSRGTHMSRFVQILDVFAAKGLKSLDLSSLCAEMAARLDTEAVRVQTCFRYFVRKPSPVSGLSAPSAYGVTVGASMGENSVSAAETTVELSVATANLCPCSKEISDEGAHNQRVLLRVGLELGTQAHLFPFPVLETLIRRLEACGSSELYPLLKRIDEKQVTEQQFANPKFIEDVAREAVEVLRSSSPIRAFSIEAQALESIHAHNAYVRYRQGKAS
ncbi:MAG: GTP cyclohydrolase I FolE2 [Bdellovibrionales bacterium]|nr:GTP cyclohydrolase I FolE2 [Bdellovibrionales bacterium]